MRNINFIFLCIIIFVSTFFIFKKAILKLLCFKERNHKNEFIPVVFEDEKKVLWISKNRLWYFSILLVLYSALGVGVFYIMKLMINHHKWIFNFRFWLIITISLLATLLALTIIIYLFIMFLLLINSKPALKKSNDQEDGLKLSNFKTITNDQEISSIKKLWKIILCFKKYFLIDLIVWLSYSNIVLLFYFFDNEGSFTKSLILFLETLLLLFYYSVMASVYSHLSKKRVLLVKYKDPEINNE